MKQGVLHVIDYCIPQDIKEFEHSEELSRARALVLLEIMLLFSATVSLLGIIIYQSLIPLPGALLLKSIIALGICIPGYLLAIFAFKSTGSHFLSGNLFALTFYLTLVSAVWGLKHEELIASLLYLLALPLLTALITNYASGIVWIIAVALAPVILNIYGSADITQFFLVNWISMCLGLFITIYISHTYQQSLRNRLDTQCGQLEFAAGHDTLTGIANRSTFNQRLHEAIDKCAHAKNQFVLVYMDLNKFKPINDTYGHQIGDAVLSTVAERLQNLARRTDTVARLGGDEFALIFEQCDPTSITPVLERIVSTINTPIRAAGTELCVGCSMGVAIYPRDGDSAQALTQKADERMYANKNARVSA